MWRLPLDPRPDPGQPDDDPVVRALFAGLGVRSEATGDAALVTLGVLLGSATWWVVLTTAVGTLRRRITPIWIHRINLVSGVDHRGLRDRLDRLGVLGWQEAEPSVGGGASETG